MKNVCALIVMAVMVVLSGCGPLKSQYIKNADISDLPTAKFGILEIKHCSPIYYVNPTIIDRTDKNLGEQIRECTNEKRYVDYTAEMSKRLSERLGNKQIALVPMLASSPLDYSPAAEAAAGKAAGVDYIIGGILHQYTCPGVGASVAGALVSGVTTALSPIALSVSSQHIVTAQVEIIRTSDGKVMGEIVTGKLGQGFMGSCTKLTRDIADEVYEQQFLAPAKK